MAPVTINATHVSMHWVQQSVHQFESLVNLKLKHKVVEKEKLGALGGGGATRTPEACLATGWSGSCPAA